jgi:predicted phosphoribosyltransferase
MRFQDRHEAGKRLASALSSYANQPGVLVLALPRGGVPLAFEIASALPAPLDVFLVRKLGAPGNEELAMGAIATGGAKMMNDDVVNLLGVVGEEIDKIVARERQEMERRERAYRGDLPALGASAIRGLTVILVDDGMATGATMQTAVVLLRQHQPEKIVVAAPVAAPSSCEAFEHLVDEIVCLNRPEQFSAGGLWYADIRQTTDEETRELLARAGKALGMAYDRSG